MQNDKPTKLSTHKTWDTGTRFQCTCGWVSHFMADEGSRSEGVSERAAHDATHKTTDWWQEWVVMIFGSRDAWRRWAMTAIRKQEAERAGR